MRASRLRRCLITLTAAGRRGDSAGGDFSGGDETLRSGIAFEQVL